jgi:ABC-type transport system involved in multi-copper enzyme maturation permease subunit
LSPALFVFAGLTLREAARRRLLIVLAILTLVSVGLTTLGIGNLVGFAREDGADPLEIDIAVSQILIFTAFMFSFVMAMTAAFLGAPAIAADIESGVAQAVLARPIRRADLLVGKWVGLAIVTAVYAAGSGLLQIVAVRAVTGYTPPHPAEAVAYLAAESVVLLTLALALSTRLGPIAAGAICVVSFGLAWMAGIVGAIAVAFGADTLQRIVEAAKLLLPTEVLWRGVVYSLEPPAFIIAAGLGGQRALAAANPFFADMPPPLTSVLWAGAWVVLILALATWSFDRREL